MSYPLHTYAIINHIESRLDKGIIGPPEACIITGYRDNGNSLLGRNFFRHDPAFGAEVQFDDCITRNYSKSITYVKEAVVKRLFLM